MDKYVKHVQKRKPRKGPEKPRQIPTKRGKWGGGPLKQVNPPYQGAPGAPPMDIQTHHLVPRGTIADIQAKSIKQIITNQPYFGKKSFKISPQGLLEGILGPSWPQEPKRAPAGDRSYHPLGWSWGGLGAQNPSKINKTWLQNLINFCIDF